MEYLDLIMRYIYVSMENFRVIISNPWTPEFFLFTAISGILLFMVSSGLWSSEFWTIFKKWGRGFGIILTAFGLVSIIITLFLGMDVQFPFLEQSSRPWSKRAANNYLSKTTPNNYLKESWGESYRTKMAMPESLTGGNQQKPVRKTLSSMSHLESAKGTPDDMPPLPPPEAKHIRKVGSHWVCEAHGKTMIYDDAKACWEPQKK